MRTRVYDIPSRIFHWLFAFSFLVAFTISNTVDDENLAFSYHMIAGLIMVFCLVLRLIWGVFGSKYAKFSDFSLNISELVAYLKGIFSGSNRKWAGHNPASSWAAVAMMVFALGLGLTGIMMTYGLGGDIFEEIHELLANSFIVVVLLHVAGVVIHQLKHKDALGMSMISGSKQGLPDHTHAVSRYTMVGLLALLMTVGFSTYLIINFDTQTRVLAVFGSNLQLSEIEDNESEEDEREENEGDDY